MSFRETKKCLDLDISVVTVHRRLLENNLFRRSPKISLLKKQIAAGPQFAKEHVNRPTEKWRKILWTDEFKVILFGGTGSRQYVCRSRNTDYNPQYIFKTVKHGAAKVLVWVSFLYNGVGVIHLIKETIDQHVLVKILANVTLLYTDSFSKMVDHQTHGNYGAQFTRHGSKTR